MADSKSRPLVLLAEDDVSMKELGVVILEEYGCEVISVPDAQMALEVAYLHPSLHLIISDVVMPGPISGYAMACELRKKQITVPIILVSGWPELPGELPAHTKFLVKPYTLESFFETLDEVLKPNQGAVQATDV
uniref:response regulator n=1 Tax=Xanthomonas sp. 0924 TaxID=2835534 RepID=UPI003F7E5E63